MDLLPNLINQECADCGQMFSKKSFLANPSKGGKWSKSCESCREIFSWFLRENRYRTIWNVFGMRCTFCKRFVGKQGNYTTLTWEANIDHILPLIHGGEDIMSNKQLLCASCNHNKGMLTEKEIVLGAGAFNKKSLIRIRS